MADSGNTNVSNQELSSVSTQEKGNRNKRKYLAEYSLDNPVDISSLSLTEFPRYELLEGKFRSTLRELASFEARHQLKEEGVESLELKEWEDPIVCQLEEILLHNICATYDSAIQKIAECGYSEEIAEWAVLRSGLYYGSKDCLSNIVDGALACLRREAESDTSKVLVFNNLEALVEYTLVEMVSMLREVKHFTVAETLWCLLICDMNISYACALEGDVISRICTNEVPGRSSSDSALQLKSEASEPSPSSPTKPHVTKPTNSNAKNSQLDKSAVVVPQIREANITEKDFLIPPAEDLVRSLGSSGENFQTVSGTTVVEEKSGGSRKGCSGNSKRDVLRQKTFHVEKSYKGRMPKGSFKAKFSVWGGMVMDKKLKSPAESSGANVKNTFSNISALVGGNVPPPADGNHNSSGNASSSMLPETDTPSALPVKESVSELPAADTKAHLSASQETKPAPNSQVNDASSSNITDYYTGMPYNEALGKFEPRDEKDEILLVLVPQLETLQKDLQGWTDWANEKVMQATRRLSKDLPELKTLRQEKEEAEKFKKEKQLFEENTIKRLSEMEYALSNATGQIEMANSTVRRLELENSILKKEMDAARLQALGSARNLQEALMREQESLKNLHSWDMQKSLMLEELTTVRRNVVEVQQKIQKATAARNRIEAQWRQVAKENENILAHAKSLRQEREHLEAAAKAEENAVRENAEKDMLKYKEDIKRLERDIFMLRKDAESAKIAALKMGIDLSFASGLTEKESSALGLSGYQTPKVSKRLAVFRDNFGEESDKRERECVMCMAEEKSVLFVPCSHQVLCAKCNVLHEKQGMTDCPSCRTPIQHRINARFASS